MNLNHDVITKSVELTENFCKTELCKLFDPYADNDTELQAFVYAVLNTTAEKIPRQMLKLKKGDSKKESESDDDVEDAGGEEPAKSGKTGKKELSREELKGICLKIGSNIMDQMEEEGVLLLSDAKFIITLLCCSLADTFDLKEEVAAHLIKEIIS